MFVFITPTNVETLLTLIVPVDQLRELRVFAGVRKFHKITVVGAGLVPSLPKELDRLLFRDIVQILVS